MIPVHQHCLPFEAPLLIYLDDEIHHSYEIYKHSRNSSNILKVFILFLILVHGFLARWFVYQTLLKSYKQKDHKLQ